MASSDPPDLDRLFAPRSIALVGASSDPDKLAGRPQRFLDAHGYDGDVHLVNPGRDAIDGRPCFDGVSEIDGPVDLAMVLVPADVVPAVVDDCGRSGIPFAVVIASGFSELGDESADRQARLRAAIETHDITVVGPNSQGVLDLHAGCTASFSSILKRSELHAGRVAFVTQSGAFGGALFQRTQNDGIGTSKWLATGNELGLTAVDALEYLVEDPETDVVVTYVESITGGERFRSIASRAVETGTEIVAMRVGISSKGQAAAASHTGSIATTDAIYEDVFSQAGIARVWSVDEFVDAVSAFSRVPSSRYPRFERSDRAGIGVVSVSGGAAVLIADTADRLGVPLATLEEPTIDALEAVIPPYGSASNPVDVTGTVISDPGVFEGCLEALVEDDAVEGLLLQFGNSGVDTVEECKAALFELADSRDVSIAAVFTGSPPTAETARDLADAGILVFEDPVRAVRALGHLGERGTFRANERRSANRDASGRRSSDRSARESISVTNWQTGTEPLVEAGVPFVETVAVGSEGEAVSAAERLGYPVVLKLDPIAVEHKSELGGVHTALSDAASVRAAYGALERIESDGAITLQPDVSGVEAIVGVVDDPDFGPVMAVGPGGIFVELFDEFAYRSLPVSADDAEEMILETRLEPLLEGYRGSAGGDTAGLASLVAAVSDAYLDYDLSELELNPVIVTPDEAVAVDLLLTTRR